jgi:hypothetical protein
LKLTPLAVVALRAWKSFPGIWISFRLGFDFLPSALLSCGQAWISFMLPAARIRLPNKA